MAGSSYYRQGKASKDRGAASSAISDENDEEDGRPFTRPGQRDKRGFRIDAGKQPGGDPGDQERKPGTNVRGRQK